jgi:hypothetical protein
MPVHFKNDPINQFRSTRAWVILLVGALVLLVALVVLIGRVLGWLAEPDKSLLTGQPCAPPCWYGIVPGKTTGEEAWYLLRENPFVHQGSLARATDRRGRTDFAWQSSKGSGPNRASLQDNVVQVLAIVPDFPLTLSEVVGRLGDPPRVLAVFTPFEIADRGYHIVLYYPSQGVIVTVSTTRLTENNHALIESNIPVDALFYFPRGSKDELLAAADQFVPSALWSEGYRPLEQDWHGFGEYEIKYAP